MQLAAPRHRHSGQQLHAETHPGLAHSYMYVVMTLTGEVLVTGHSVPLTALRLPTGRGVRGGWCATGDWERATEHLSLPCPVLPAEERE